ncbi:MAG: hypothetical protein ACI84C_000817 [Flavobacteriales bacterium]
MNKLSASIITLVITVVLLSCGSKDKNVTTDLINIVPGNNIDTSTLPIITFEDSTYNFGKVSEGELVKYTYKFENTGNAPLIISRVETSCGCTTAKDWSEAPYSTGAEGEITIEFDTNKRPGHQKKSIDIITNSVPAVIRIYLEGDVAGPLSK